MSHRWPELHLAEWRATRDVLHMWTQIIGKVRLALAPRVNHWWHVPLYVTACGLTTSAMPYEGQQVEVEFDFLRHRLMITKSDGQEKSFELAAFSVAEFYDRFFDSLKSLGVNVKIWSTPVEVLNPVAFPEDKRAAYDKEYVQRFWQVLASSADVLQEFRSAYIGKCSPVHFFWGSFDLAVTRFSGRRAPERPGADVITREAYTHEVSSVGWWPGSGNVAGPAFYSYTAPEPPGFREWKVRPEAARYDTQLGEFILMYEDVSRSASPRETLLDFCQSTYEAGATLGKWDRSALERAPGAALDKTA
jgi:hypothetical protein